LVIFRVRLTIFTFHLFVFFVRMQGVLLRVFLIVSLLLPASLFQGIDPFFSSVLPGLIRSGSAWFLLQTFHQIYLYNMLLIYIMLLLYIKVLFCWFILAVVLISVG
jgi:hypothetical protein